MRSIAWRPRSNGRRNIARTEAEKGETGSRFEGERRRRRHRPGAIGTNGTLVVKPIRGFIEAKIAADVVEGSGNTHPVMIISVPQTTGAYSCIGGALCVRHGRPTLGGSQR
jgi:hypothetical protein